MEKYLRYLTNRDVAMLAFIARYRVGTNELLLKAVCENRCTLANVDRIVRRLQRRGLLRSVELDAQVRYFVLTRRGFIALGMEPRTPRALTEQSLPVVLALSLIHI